MNAVVVKGDAVGSTLFYGRGAGAEPTASAVVADLVDIVRMTAAGDAQALKPAEHNQETTQLGWLPMSQTVSSYYLRIPVADEPGVLAQAIEAIEALPSTRGKVVMIRKEELN